VLAFGVDSAWAEAAVIVAVLFGAYILTMWVAAILWTYRDVHARTHDVMTQVVSVVLVAAFNLPGLLLYLLLRPQETIGERAERQIELDAFLRDMDRQSLCPGCERSIDGGFVACPYCRTQLAQPCRSCGRNMADAWLMCPYCLAERPDAAERAAAAAAPAVRQRKPAWRRALRPEPGMGPQPATAAQRHAS
jgi:hypothetical protein